MSAGAAAAPARSDAANADLSAPKRAANRVSVMKRLAFVVAAGLLAGFAAGSHAPLGIFAGILVIALMASVVREAWLANQRVQTKAHIPTAAKIKRRALVIGAGTVGLTLAEHLESAGEYEVAGFIDEEDGFSMPERWAVLGDRAHAESVIEAYDIEEVFVAYAPAWQHSLVENLAARRPEVSIHVVPTSYEAMLCTSQVQSYGDVAVVRLMQTPRMVSQAIKRLFDISSAILGLFLSLPLSLLAIAAIKMSAPGPVFFAQERVGRHGRTFLMYKFRTMRVDAESATGPVRSSGKDDPRLTPIGRWLRLVRIDEIPQLWNVLRGDMSMVGPRPERPWFTEQFVQLVPSYAKRHHVRPGITGLAQVCGGYHTDARDKLRFDLMYISHQSVWLDICILWRTIQVVVQPQAKSFERDRAAAR